MEFICLAGCYIGAYSVRIKLLQFERITACNVSDARLNSADICVSDARLNNTVTSVSDAR